MSADTEPQIPPDLQPRPEDVGYDLTRALSAVVSVRAQIPEDAFTASILGTERSGHGVLIRDDGLIVTIGYLIAEADQIWIVDQSGQVVPGHVIGYDYETGFGLVQGLGPLPLPTLELGNSADLRLGDEVVVAAFGGLEQSISAQVISKSEFAGYWEYVLDEAIFTTPPHPNWGGAALLGNDGRLCGIGSLYIQGPSKSQAMGDGNMVVPIDILKPIMDEMLLYGRTLKPARPWLGMFVTEFDDELVVVGVFEGAPAHAAGVCTGDRVLGVGGEPVIELADLFRRIWATGEAGVEIPLRLSRDGSTFEVRVRSIDLRDHWRSPDVH